MTISKQELVLQKTFGFTVSEGIRLYTVDFVDNSNNYQYTRPYYVTIDGQEHSVSSWADAVVLVCNFFIKKDKVKFDKVSNGFLPAWTKRVFISSNTDNHFVCPKPLENGLFVETDTDSMHLIWLIRDLCGKMKYDAKNIVISYKKRPKEEAKEIKDFYRQKTQDSFVQWLKDEKKESVEQTEKSLLFFEKLDKILASVQKNVASLYLFDYNKDSVIAKESLLKFAETRYIEKPEVVTKVQRSMDLLIEFYQFKNQKFKTVVKS